jgi:hypothetical protein
VFSALSKGVRLPAATALAGALVALAGCGSSTPEYCSNRTDLQNSVKDLPSTVSSGDVSAVQAQVQTIKSDATALVDSAKSDFSSETSAVKSSVDTLSSSAEALPSSPSATQIAAVAAGAAGVVNSVKSFMDASDSKCS